MKVPVMLIVSAVMMQSCNSQEKNKPKTADTRTQTMRAATSQKQGFDLSDLSFTESVAAVETVSGVKFADHPSQEKTLFGYERMESTDAILLNYAHNSLAGNAGAEKNRVIIHYLEKTSVLAMYELRVYSKLQNDMLQMLITNKTGKPVIEKYVQDAESGEKFKQLVWIKGDVIYLMLEILDKTGVKTSNLAVFKNNKDFYVLLEQKGYAIDAKSLIEAALKKAGK